jgi:hypothetical protein
MTNPVTGKDIWYYEMVIKPFVGFWCAKFTCDITDKPLRRLSKSTLAYAPQGS